MANFLEFLPDPVLINIFSRLYATDLYNLQSVNSRFALLIEDKYIWKHIHFGSNPLSLEHVRRFVKYFGNQTKSLNITGHIRTTVLARPKRSQFISEAFFLSLKRRCPDLEELHLNKCYIDSSSAKFSCLPSSLQILSLSGSYIANLPAIRTRLNSPFFRIEKHIPKLYEIQLIGCKSWLSPSDLAVLMKSCKSLHIINVGTFRYVRSGKNIWVKQETSV